MARRGIVHRQRARRCGDPPRAHTHRQSPPEGSMIRTPTTVDPAASARDAAAEVLSSVRGETLRQYIEECDRLRAEVDRWRSVAWLVAIRVGDSPDEAERSLRSIVHHQDVG